MKRAGRSAELKTGLEQIENLWGNMVEKHVGKDIQPRSRFGLVVGTLNHVAILCVTVIIVWTAQPSSSLFSWHPSLMSIAVVLLMSEAVLLFSVWSSPAQGLPRASKVQWHWVLQASCLACAFTGLAVITTNKLHAGKQHYTTWHGLIGITVIGSMAIQAAGGISILWPAVLPIKVKLVTLKKLHAMCGMINYSGAILAILLGLYSTWFLSSVVNTAVWTLCVISVVFLVISVSIQVAYNYICC